MSSNLSIRQAVGMAVGTAGVAVTAGFAPMAMADPAAAAGPSADTTAPDTTLQEVVVTGSRIRRVDTETASPVFVLDQKAIQESGINTIGDLLERVPSVSGAATNPQVNNGGGFGESCVELRGLDCKRTLVLVDGRRIGLVGTTSDATDVNQIPLPLVERVEVLKEGAGAIYGSDAIGGVVNFITRKDVEGVEINADYGKTTKSDGAHHDVSIMFGTNTDKFNFVVGGDIQQAGRSLGRCSQLLEVCPVPLRRIRRRHQGRVEPSSQRPHLRQPAGVARFERQALLQPDSNRGSRRHRVDGLPLLQCPGRFVQLPAAESAVDPARSAPRCSPRPITRSTTTPKPTHP